MDDKSEIIEMTADIVSAHVSNNSVSTGELPGLISSVFASLAGLGISLLPEDEVMAHMEAGRLVRVLQDWCPKFAGYHLYYPSKRQASPAFSLVVKALRFSGSRQL